ncbi:MAG: hypothetical protein QM711_13430 [Micropruina sp.]
MAERGRPGRSLAAARLRRTRILGIAGVVVGALLAIVALLWF